MDVFLLFVEEENDAIITHELSPITQLISVCILGLIRKVPVYSRIMDIWPDAMNSSISPKLYKIVGPILTAITEWTYRHSDKILITSKGFEQLICRNADYHDKIIYYPNLSVDMSVNKSGFVSLLLPDGFRIMLAGNLRDAQDLDSVEECMKLLKNYKQDKWIFVGYGSKKQWMDRFIAEKV